MLASGVRPSVLGGAGMALPEWLLILLCPVTPTSAPPSPSFEALSEGEGTLRLACFLSVTRKCLPVELKSETYLGIF